MELGGGWNELGVGGWSWVEVGARFSKTQNLFYSKKSYKKLGKEAGTNFILLSRSRSRIGWFMQTYLFKPIKILQFVSRGKIQNCLT